MIYLFARFFIELSRLALIFVVEFCFTWRSKLLKFSPMTTLLQSTISIIKWKQNGLIDMSMLPVLFHDEN